jgi:hypothetical protein
MQDALEYECRIKVISAPGITPIDINLEAINLSEKSSMMADSPGLS